MNDLLHDQLLPGGKVLWTGKPDPSILFAPAGMFLVPFSWLWGGGVLSITATMIFAEGEVTEPILAFVFMVFFVAMAIYILFGRFVYKNHRKKHTLYAITDKRILVQTDLRKRHLEAIFLNTIPVINNQSEATEREPFPSETRI
jgi:predicted membrane protein